MKVLHLNSYFLLPDDFDGDVNDAIQCLLEYRKNRNLTEFKNDNSSDKPWEELSQNEKWERFCEATQKGLRHTGSACFSEFDDNTKEWRSL